MLAIMLVAGMLFGILPALAASRNGGDALLNEWTEYEGSNDDLGALPGVKENPNGFQATEAASIPEQILPTVFITNFAPFHHIKQLLLFC